MLPGNGTLGVVEVFLQRAPNFLIAFVNAKFAGKGLKFHGRC
jgi:hypothetical protein